MAGAYAPAECGAGSIVKRLPIGITSLCLLLAGLLTPLKAQRARGGGAKSSVITNADVIRLVKRGVAEVKIIEQLRNSKLRFNTSAEALRRLRRAGAGDALIKEIFNSREVARVADPAGNGSAPCTRPLAGTEAAADGPGYDRLPPSRFHEFIKPDDSSTRRLPPESSSGTGQPPGMGWPMRIGVVRPLAPPLTTSEHGKCFGLSRGYAEVLRIVSEGARQMRAHFVSVALPPGARLFVYSGRDAREVYGPYEGRGPSSDGTFWTPPVEGDSIVVEFYAPGPAAGRRAPFQIIEVSHIF